MDSSNQKKEGLTLKPSSSKLGKYQGQNYFYHGLPNSVSKLMFLNMCDLHMRGTIEPNANIAFQRAHKLSKVDVPNLNTFFFLFASMLAANTPQPTDQGTFAPYWLFLESHRFVDNLGEQLFSKWCRNSTYLRTG